MIYSAMVSSLILVRGTTIQLLPNFKKHRIENEFGNGVPSSNAPRKLTWLVLGGDPAARSHRVEQFTAL